MCQPGAEIDQFFLVKMQNYLFNFRNHQLSFSFTNQQPMEGTLLLQQAEVEDAGDWDRVEIEARHILYIRHIHLYYTL